MVVKLMKWSIATRKYKVKVKPMKLECCWDDEDDEKSDQIKVMEIKVKWKGQPKFGLVPFHRRKDFSKERIVKSWEAIVVEWKEEDDDDEWFQNICSFTVVSTNDEDGRKNFGPWDISFSVLYGDKKEKKKMRWRKSKLEVIGKASLNIAEMASRYNDHHYHGEVDVKLAINLELGGVSRTANLMVRLEFVEVGDLQVLNNSIEPSQNAADTSSGTRLESVKKTGLFSWEKRRLSSKPAAIKGEKEETFDGVEQQQCTGPSIIDPVISGSPQVDDQGAWESKEVTSRDGQIKLKTNVFFASFDQCSNKAAGESACTALVAVIAHWLLVNRCAVPTRPEFDALILEGSSEWRRLCGNDAYINDFPNKHFDLETVLRAEIRPIAISRDDSFVGFFSPEKFESLKEAMSFDEIWDGIDRVSDGIYIVSWNDHFFVLKVEANAYYIIDTLGERLFEGCNQAYIIRFDNTSSMLGKHVVNEEGEASGSDENTDAAIREDNTEEILVCSGKECCKEFIKRFLLAANPLEELEAEEKRGPVSYYSLHQRLQIEINFSYLLSSSLKSSPFSSSSNSAYSWSVDECMV